MKKLLLSCVFLLLPCLSQAVDMSIKHTTYKDVSSEKTFFVDRYGSMYAGASMLLSTRSFLHDVETYLLPEKIRQNFWWSVGFMSVEMLLIDFPLLSFYYSFFGRGFRIRSLGGTVQSYQFGFFKPDINYSTFWPDHAYDIPVLMSIASYEANQVLLQEIVFKSLRDRYLDRSMVVLYTVVNFARLGHPLGTEEEVRDNTDKIFDYLYQINAKHQGKAKLKPAELKRPLLILIPDFLIKLGIAFLQNKDSKLKPPMLAIQEQDVVYLPFLSPQYTPFGIGYCMDNYLRYHDKIFLMSFHLGKSPFYTHYYGGIGSKTDGLYTYKRYTVDLAAHLWYQPKLLLLQATDVLEDKSYWGGLIGVYNKFKINPHFSLYGAMLYKTAGYLEGMVAQKGFIWQAGLKVSYNVDIDHFYVE